MLVNRSQKEEANPSQQTLELLKAIDQKLSIITAIAIVAALMAIFG